MGKIAGIDLGTTFSAIAILNEIGKPEVIPNRDGDRITPSVLYFDEYVKDKVLVGTEALNGRLLDVSRSARWIKRHMGEKEYPGLLNGRTWSPSELSSFILRKLAEDASLIAGKIEGVVITVPAHFDEIRRKATMDAGVMAGLNVVGIINEPTAAALYYSTVKDVSGRVFIFDLGGGTFDVAIADVNGTDVSIVCSGGDHNLGGYNFDEKLLELFDKEYEAIHGKTLYANDEDRAAQAALAESCKYTLSSRPKTRASIAGKEGMIRFELDRAGFEELISADIARMDMLVESVLEEADCRPDDISRVLLVGGSTRMPIVKQRLASIFGQEPMNCANVDECVALGAAIHAGLTLVSERPDAVSPGVASAMKDIQLSDVCNHSYGTTALGFDEHTEAQALVNTIVIEKNTPVPCEITVELYTAVDAQQELRCDVTQGESSDPMYVNTLAEETMTLPPGRPANCPIRITYSYDKNARMHCVFEDVQSGKRVQMDIDAQAGGVSHAEIESKQSLMDAFEVE